MEQPSMADKKKTLVVFVLAVLGPPLCTEQITAELYSPSSYQKSSCSNLSPPAALSGATVPEEAYVASIFDQAFGATKYKAESRRVGKCAGETPLPTWKWFQPITEWKRWSKISSWSQFNAVPGTDDRLDNVTIPCGDFVIYDMAPLANGSSAIQLQVLKIDGMIRFLDSSEIPEVALSADIILVTGKLQIGSADEHFSQKATITLTGNRKQPLPGFEDVGFKVLAAVGGQISLYGMPSGPQTPSWVSLSAFADAGKTDLTVDRDVSGWPVGGKVAVASTDFDPLQTETATILAAEGTSLTLDRPLIYSHFAPSVATGYKNISMPMAGEVALLTRNIHITAAEEAPPSQLVGGQVMVYNTQAAQVFFGVEFSRLGQQGNLGRYPLHFHMCGAMPDSIVRSNSVRDSLQRGYVIHGTHRLEAADNLAFNISGHAFMFEDGIEQNNTLRHNLVVYTKPVEVLIPQEPNNTDDQPSCFWSASPTNVFVNNTAVGCVSGFWFELLTHIKGISGNLRGAVDLEPFTAALGGFSDNIAHSNTDTGLRMYKQGYRPLQNQTIHRFVAYKNEIGISLHGSSQLIVDDALLSDHKYGIDTNGLGGHTIQNSVVIGLSENYGNPVRCAEPGFACEPISGNCDSAFNHTGLPNSPGPGFRTVPRTAVREGDGSIGVVVAANTAAGNVFVNFNSSCGSWGAIGINNVQPGSLSVGGVTWNSTFVNTPLENRVYINPQQGPREDQYWVVRDADGSIAGEGVPSTIVANGSAVLLPLRGSNASCVGMPTWGGHLCKGVCQRSLHFKYNEPGVEAGRKPFNGSTMRFTRNADNASQISTMLSFYPPDEWKVDPKTEKAEWIRHFYVNVLGGYQYDARVQGGLGELPETLVYEYNDGGQPANPACSAVVDLTFQSEINAEFLS